MSQGAHIKEDEQSSLNSPELRNEAENNSGSKFSIDFLTNIFKNFDAARFNPKVAIGAAAAILLCIVLIVAISSGHKSEPAAELTVEDDISLDYVMMYENNITLSDSVAFTSRTYNITLSDSGNEALYINAFNSDPELLTAFSKKLSNKDDALKKIEQLAKLLTPSFFAGKEIVSECAGSADVGRYVVSFTHTGDNDRIEVSVSADGKLETYYVMRSESAMITIADESFDVFTYCVENEGDYFRCDQLPELGEITYSPFMSISSSVWQLTGSGEVYTTDGRLVLDSEYFKAPFAAFCSLTPGNYIVQMPIINNSGRNAVKVMCFGLNVPDNSPYIPYSPAEMHDIVKAENPAFPNATPIYNAADLDWFRYQLMLAKPTVAGDHSFKLPALFTRDDGKVLVAYPSGDSSPIVYAGTTNYLYDADTNEFFNHIFEIG